MEEVVLFFHLLGVLLFAAGIAVAGIAFETARRRERPAEIALLLGLSRVGALLVLSGGLLLLVCGLWLVELEDIGFGAGWIDAAMAIFAVALILGALGGQRPKRARKLADGLVREGKEPDAELRMLLDDRLSRAGNYASAVLVLTILALMVFKP
jgi:uncharacterized membrane protein